MCLIVRDEERHLPTCLAAIASLGDLVGTICVYDTGSRDATREIARGAGARVEAGFWDDDFARARNASLAMADHRWALIVDADDVVVADPVALRATVEGASGTDVLRARFSHLDADGTVRSHSTRFALVRRDLVRFTSAIHEVPGRLDERPTLHAQLDPAVLRFNHTGYADAQLRRRKAIRNLASADLAVAQARTLSDSRLVAQSLYHRARCELVLGQDDAAADDLTAALQWTAPQDDALRLMIGSEAAPALLRVGRHQDTLQLAQRFASEAGGSELAGLILGLSLLELGHNDDAHEVLWSIPDEPREGGGVDLAALYAGRIKAARRTHRADEALAHLLVRVGRDGTAELVPHLMEIWGDQAPAALAQLLREASPSGRPAAAVRDALLVAGPVGRQAARLV